MNVASALALINSSLVYKPDWEITAEDHENRFEGAIKLNVAYPARQSERADAPEGYPTAIKGGAHASFVLIVSDLDDMGVYRQILIELIKIETHEAREFLRVRPTYWAPFHPHRADGMARWGTPDLDMTFGVA